MDLAVPDLMPGYEVRARTAVRKAAKSGLLVEWWPPVRLLDTFMPLYHATMAALHASAYYFFPAAYFEAISEWDSVHFAVCRHDGDVVGAAIFLHGPACLEYHLSASSPVGRRLGATNLLLHEAARYGQKLGCQRLHLGGGTNSAPDNPLLFFKRGFSKRNASFRIGRRVHQATAYAAMRSSWAERFGSVGNRVLFYRDN